MENLNKFLAIDEEIKEEVLEPYIEELKTEESIRKIFDSMVEDGRKTYKVTVTFNRKCWRLSHAFKRVFIVLSTALAGCDVSEGVFTMETHIGG